jgi:integrase
VASLNFNCHGGPRVYRTAKIKAENDYADSTLFKIKDYINHFFKFLLEEEIIKINPVNQITFKRNEKGRRVKYILSSEEVKEMLAKFYKYDPVTLYPYIYCITHTGARRNEVSGLKWPDVDLKSRYITFRKTKNGTDRRIKIGPKLAQVIKKQQLNAGDSEYVFHLPNSQRINQAYIHRALVAFQGQYGQIKPFRLHDLRHSFSWNYLKSGGEMYQLQAILGHKSIKMTVDLYGHFKAADVKRVSPYFGF